MAPEHTLGPEQASRTLRFFAAPLATCLTNVVLLHAVLLGMASLGANEAQAMVSARPVWVEKRPFLRVLEGEVPAPKRRVVRYRVLVERGLEAEAEEFSELVDKTLADPNGWSSAGREFVRVEEWPHITILLATPDTVDTLCAPLRTAGQLSCGRKGRASINLLRWRQGSVHWGEDLDGYRGYMINHEVGHLLGQPHRPCPGEGEMAPVMVQQTKALKGCFPENRPSDEEIASLRKRWKRW